MTLTMSRWRHRGTIDAAYPFYSAKDFFLCLGASIASSGYHEKNTPLQWSSVGVPSATHFGRCIDASNGVTNWYGDDPDASMPSLRPHGCETDTRSTQLKLRPTCAHLHDHVCIPLPLWITLHTYGEIATTEQAKVAIDLAHCPVTLAGRFPRSLQCPACLPATSRQRSMSAYLWP